MRLPVSGERKKQIALAKLHRSQFWVVGAVLICALTIFGSVQLLHSAQTLKEAQQANALKTASPSKQGDPRRTEALMQEVDYQTTVTLTILFGIGDIVVLTWAIRKYRWHNYLYQKEFGRRRRTSYSAAYPGASNDSQNR